MNVGLTFKAFALYNVGAGEGLQKIRLDKIYAWALKFLRGTKKLKLDHCGGRRVAKLP